MNFLRFHIIHALSIRIKTGQGIKCQKSYAKIEMGPFDS